MWCRLVGWPRSDPYLLCVQAGYQITQQRVPIAEHGQVKVGHGAGESVVRIERLHLEHDSGKSIHTLSDRFSVVDLNRCGKCLGVRLELGLTAFQWWI
jgi:aspartyl-tRNA(Asn)/glutamyl-tRNA(Gln) amidotransferase subunit B